MPYDEFCTEVISMLADLAAFRDALPAQQAARLYLMQHVIIPSFSGILVDDGLPSARLQIETKLYGAARSDSYGLTLVSLYQAASFMNAIDSPTTGSYAMPSRIPTIVTDQFYRPICKQESK